MNDDRRHNRDRDHSRPVVELISAYLDDRENLSSRELEHVEQLLAQDREAQQIHAELRAITRELGNLDPVVAPRSYHLDAEMVGAPEPVVLQETSAWYVRHSQKVRWVTAAAAMLFVFVLGADLIVNGVFSDTTDDGPVFDTNQAEITSRQADDDDAAAGGAEEEVAEEEEAEAFQEYAADDAGESDDADGEDEAIEAEEESGTLMAEPTAEAEDGAVGDQDSDTTDEPIPPVDDAAGGDEAAEPDVAEDSAPPIQTAALDESASGEQTLAFEENAAEADEGDSDRRLWRIAEFSLVVVLGLLITAMIVLPRLGGGMARSRQGE